MTRAKFASKLLGELLHALVDFVLFLLSEGLELFRVALLHNSFQGKRVLVSLNLFLRRKIIFNERIYFALLADAGNSVKFAEIFQKVEEKLGKNVGSGRGETRTIRAQRIESQRIVALKNFHPLQVAKLLEIKLVV